MLKRAEVGIDKKSDMEVKDDERVLDEREENQGEVKRMVEIMA